MTHESVMTLAAEPGPRRATRCVAPTEPGSVGGAGVPAGEWVLPLQLADQATQVGGKAWNLQRLLSLGVPVPQGFVVTDAALAACLDAAQCRASIDAMLVCVDTVSPVSLNGTAGAIRSLVETIPFPAALHEAIDVHSARLDGGPLIVRSSALGEDSTAASFAGQLDSIAGVMGGADVAAAITRCWASRWSARVLAYESARDIRLDGIAVIVQQQVRSAVSGVLFTIAPGRDEGRMLVEYCEGLGEALVSGRVNPGRLSIARADFGWRQEARPESPFPAESLLVNDEALARLGRLARAIEQAFGNPQDIEWTIDEEGQLWIVQARPITAGVRGVRETTSTAVAPTSTAVAPASTPVPPASLPAITPDPLVLWSNANVNENFPEPISPLLYSLASVGYYNYFRNLGRAFGLSQRRLGAIEQPLRQIIGVHGARMYYNLSSIHQVLRSAPFGEQLAQSFNRFVGASETAPRQDAGRAASGPAGRIRQSFEVGVIAASTAWQYLYFTRRVERFEATADAFAARTHPDRLATASRAELLDDLRAFMEIRCVHWKDASLADAASMVCYGVLQKLLARAFPGRDQQALHNTLLKALPDLVSSKPAIALWDLSRRVRADKDLLDLFASPSPLVLTAISTDPRYTTFRTAFSAYLETWGFRSSSELMLTVPSFQEEPAPLIDIIRAYAATDGDSPATILHRQQAERLTDTAQVLSTLRRRRVVSWLPLLKQSHVVGTALRWTQRAIGMRERARLKQALLYSRLRRVAMAIGDRLAGEGRLRRREDVFFLTVDELDALLSGAAMFPDHVGALADLRRDAHATLSAMQPADTFRLPAGEYLPTRAAVAEPEAKASGLRKAEAVVATPASDSAAQTERDDLAKTLHGTGACGGRIAARAIVLREVTEAHRLKAGDVLVTRQTDPGWGPVFPLVSGLVIERGGMLSHGAILAREFGIPSVVGVRDATRLIPDGGQVIVDGDRGTVRIVV